MIFQIQIDQARQDIIDFNARFTNPPASFRDYGAHELREVVAYLRQRGVPNLQMQDLQIIPNQSVIGEIDAVRREFGIVREVRGIINSRQPLILTISSELLNRISVREASALQLSGTNICLISAEEAQTPRRNNLIRHEVGHYFDNLIHGDLQITINDIYGDQTIQSKPQWLVEGINELRTARATRVYTYKYETLSAAILEHAVGEETLRRARISGDFREVQRMVDRECGIGVFEQFITCQTSAEAYFLLSRNLMRNPQFEISRFENDPVVRNLLELSSRPEPQRQIRIPERFEFVAQTIPQRIRTNEEALDEELSEYSPQLRERFSDQDLIRIRDQLTRVPNQQEVRYQVQIAIARVRPDLAALRLIEDWNAHMGQRYGLIDAETSSRICGALEKRSINPDSNEMAFNRVEAEINMAFRRIERNFRRESALNSITQYCSVNQVQVPQGNEIELIGVNIANNSRIEIEQIRDEALRQFRAHFPNIATEAEYNRYRNMGVRVPIVQIEGEIGEYDFERGSRIFRENTRVMIAVAREVLTAPKNQTERNNGNITISTDYPLSMSEMFGSELFERIRRGERISRGNVFAYYNFDINAVIIETADHRAVAFFDEDGEISQIRSFNNRAMNRRETQNHQRIVDQGIESSRSGNGQMLREVLSSSYSQDIITDIGLRRIGEWDTIIRQNRQD